MKGTQMKSGKLNGRVAVVTGAAKGIGAGIAKEFAAEMVAIPNAYDQPGVAARVAYHGVGEFLEIDDLAVEPVQRLI
jgi:NAD(P)-dependent dehydrogenase (short-subunit alcohol dehydrogenase family)